MPAGYTGPPVRWGRIAIGCGILLVIVIVAVLASVFFVGTHF